MIEDLSKEEIYINYKKNKTNENAYELVNFICENIENIDLSNINNIALCEYTTRYLFNVKIGKWNEFEAKFIIYYLAKKCSKYFEINDELSINILNEQEYKEKHGEDSIAVCVTHNDSTFDVNYSPTVIEKLMSNNINDFLRGLCTLFHELVHVRQNIVIQKDNEEYNYTKKTYLITLETITRKADKKFYIRNYLNLFKENQADKIGLQNALEVIKKYNSKLYDMYDEEFLQRKIDELEKKLSLEYQIQIYNSNTNKVIEAMDYICSLEIKKDTKYLEKYPILKLIYNLDGTKKDIVQLYQERTILIKNGANKEKIDLLYECISNNKIFAKKVENGYESTYKEEAELLIDYIQKNKVKDDFLIDLLIYRLKKGKLSEEKINKIFEILGINNDQEPIQSNKEVL